MGNSADRKVISYVADINDIKAKLKQIEALNKKASQTLGTDFTKNIQKVSGEYGKFSDVQIKKVDSAFKSLIGTTQQTSKQVKLANGQFATLTTTVSTFGKTNEKGIVEPFQKTTRTLKDASASTKNFGENLKFLAKRALTVIPVWLLLRTTFMAFIRLIQSSVRFLVDWEYQMAQIAIVGKGTKEELDAISNSLLSLSSSLGISNKNLGEGAKLFFQQGRAIKEIIPLMSATAKLSLLTGRTITQSVEDMTAILKAYKLEASDAISVVDGITNAMLNHAITAGDLTSAYKQVASTASALGVSFSALTGFITAIKAETRDAGGKIGLSLRTMFTRIATTSAEALQKLTLVPFFLDKTGKVTKDITPTMRNLENIIFDVAGAFQNLTNVQQAEVAKLIGGVRRANQVFALFNNFTEAINTQTDALFGLAKADKAVAELVDTTKLRLEQLSAAWLEFVDAVGDTGAFKGALDILKNQIVNISTILNPTRILAIEVGKRFDEQVVALARQKNLVDSILSSIARAKSLDEVLSRGGENIELIERQIQSLVKGINTAGAGFNIKVGAEIKNPSDLIQSLEAQFDKLEALTVQTRIEIPIQENLKEIASLGAVIKSTMDKAIEQTGVLNFGRLFGKGKKEIEDIKSTLTQLTLGAIIEDKDLEKLKAFSKEILATDKFKGISTLLDQVATKQEKVNSLASGERVLREGLLSTLTQKNSLIETEFQLNSKLNELRLVGTQTGRFEIDILEDQLDVLEAQKDSLSDELFQKRLNIEQKITKLYYEQGQNIKKIIIANQILQLKNAKELESTISKTKHELNEQFNIREDIEAKLDRQLDINEQIRQESKAENQILINHHLEILKLQGATTRQLLEQRRILENTFNIDKSRNDKIKEELNLQKEITREKLQQDKISSESIKLFQIASKFGRRTASEALQVIRGEQDLPREGSTSKTLQALKEFFPSLVEAKRAFDFFSTGRGSEIPIKEKGLFPFQSLPSIQTRADLSQIPSLAPTLATLNLPKIETRIDNVKIELKQLLKKEDLTGQILNDLAGALRENPSIQEAIENIIENY